MSDSQSSVPFHQIILLNRTGRVRYSCETLVELRAFKEQSVLEKSPFLESVFPQLLIRRSHEKALRYGRLESPFPGLKGTYDFSFQWVEIHDGNYILWNIYDLSDLYSTIKQAQQQRNEQAISAERLGQISKRDMSNWNET